VSLAIIREAAKVLDEEQEPEEGLGLGAAPTGEAAEAAAGGEDWAAGPAGDSFDAAYEISGKLEEELPAITEEPKATSYNLKQLAGKASRIPLHVMERLLATTSIHATDVESGQTFLEHACNTGDMQLAKLCFRRGMSLNMLTASGDTPFNICIRRGDREMVAFLRGYGVKVNSQDRDGVAGMHVAAQKNDVDCICRLVEWAADVHVSDTFGRTPLHFAAKYGRDEASMLLLELAADMNAMDNKNITPVGYAEQHDQFKLMDRLVELGGFVSRPGKEACTKAPGVVAQPKWMLNKAPHMLRLGKFNTCPLPV